MRRRRFVFGLLSISALMPGLSALRAQQPSRMRRVAVLMLYAEKDPEGQARARAFRDGLEKLGWVLGKTIAIDFLWGVLPRSYIYCSRKQAGSDPFAQFATRLKNDAAWRYFEMDASHSPNVTAPEALMKVLQEIVA
jgi:hypothetical protein